MRSADRHPHTARRMTVLGMVTALLLTLLPAAVTAQTPEARGIDHVCPPPGQEADDGPRFDDTAGTAHEESIACVAQYRIADGYPDGDYRPHVAINRAQMASLVRAFVETALGEQLPDAEPGFSDVPPDSTHANSIGAIAQAGIVAGFGDGTYRPHLPVRRDQMATFVANAVDFAFHWQVTGQEPPPTETRFFDDTEGSPHAASIDRLAAQGIVAGVDERRYHPGGLVMRGQMATFLMRGGDYIAAEGMWFYSPYQFIFDPELASLLVGTQHTVSVTILDRDDQPLAHEDVELATLRFNTQDFSSRTQTTTDADGWTSITFTGPETSDLEAVVACIRPASCGDGEEVSGHSGAALVFWARHAEDGESSQWEFIVGSSPEESYVDSYSIRDDTYEFLTRRWTYKDGDAFRDDSQGEGREIALEEFAEMTSGAYACIIEVESYSTTQASTFVIIACAQSASEQHAQTS